MDKQIVWVESTASGAGSVYVNAQNSRAKFLEIKSDDSITKVRQACFQTFSTVWKGIEYSGKVNGLRSCFKDESLLQPSRTTLKGF